MNMTLAERDRRGHLYVELQNSGVVQWMDVFDHIIIVAVENGGSDNAKNDRIVENIVWSKGYCLIYSFEVHHGNGTVIRMYVSNEYYSTYVYMIGQVTIDALSQKHYKWKHSMDEAEKLAEKLSGLRLKRTMVPDGESILVKCETEETFPKKDKCMIEYADLFEGAMKRRIGTIGGKKP